MDLQKINNIIFDLGGVIIDIDPMRSFDALKKLAKQEQADKFSEISALFLDFETGAMDNATFYRQIRELAEQEALEDEIIAEAWNAMLLDIPADRLEVLRKLKKKYRLFVLSNTNDIHVTAFNKIVKSVCGEEDLACFFDKVYFSHDLKMRKPDAEIYAFVLNDNQLIPEETLFIDDRPENIEAAKALGIQTFQATKEKGIVAFFESL